MPQTKQSSGHSVDRRLFLKAGTAGVSACLLGRPPVHAKGPAESRGEPTRFQIACMTLPYGAFPFDRALQGIRAPLTVAIMGCVVNGPGEAAEADVAICAAKNKAFLYRRGKKIRTIQPDQIAAAVLAEVRALSDSAP